MTTTNEEDVAECPVCGKECLKRGLYMHIFQSRDEPGEGHYPRFEFPPDIDAEEIRVTDTREVQMDYPDERDTENHARLCPYCSQTFAGINGLMIHLGQTAGRKNHPEDPKDRHQPSRTFPA